MQRLLNFCFEAHRLLHTKPFIHSFWDRIFNTLNPIHKKTGIMFSVNFL